MGQPIKDPISDLIRRKDKTFAKSVSESVCIRINRELNFLIILVI